MTAIVNNVIVSGTPEEIKALIDLCKPPVEYDKEVLEHGGWESTGKKADEKIGGKLL